MNHNKLLRVASYALLASILMTSCEDALVKDLDFEEDFDLEQVLGMSGAIYHQYGGDPEMRLSRIALAESQSIIESPGEFNVYEGADLQLSKGGEFLGSFIEQSPGVYIGVDSNLDGFILPPDEYRLSVTHPTFGEVSATTVMPDPVFLTEVTADSLSTPIPEFSDLTDYLMTIKFTDPPGPNYYGIEIDSELEPGDSFSLNPRFAALNNPNLVSIDRDLVVVSDELFDDSDYTISFYFSLSGGHNFSFDEIKSRLRVKWNCMSEDLYKFYVSYNNYENTNDSGPFTEPVTLYTNIENGLGYFGASNFYIEEVSN